MGNGVQANPLTGSTLPTADQDLDVHGDDAAALLAAVTDQPAYVRGGVTLRVMVE
jgi:hypothetical protein